MCAFPEAPGQSSAEVESWELEPERELELELELEAGNRDSWAAGWEQLPLRNLQAPDL